MVDIWHEIHCFLPIDLNVIAIRKTQVGFSPSFSFLMKNKRLKLLRCTYLSRRYLCNYSQPKSCCYYLAATRCNKSRLCRRRMGKKEVSIIVFSSELAVRPTSHVHVRSHVFYASLLTEQWRF